MDGGRHLDAAVVSAAGAVYHAALGGDLIHGDKDGIKLLIGWEAAEAFR